MKHSITEKINELRNHLIQNADNLEDCRAKSLTITKLEESQMWSEKIYSENNES